MSSFVILWVRLTFMAPRGALLDFSIQESGSKTGRKSEVSELPCVSSFCYPWLAGADKEWFASAQNLLKQMKSRRNALKNMKESRKSRTIRQQQKEAEGLLKQLCKPLEDMCDYFDQVRRPAPRRFPC